jgi:hypothetical protein
MQGMSVAPINNLSAALPPKPSFSFLLAPPRPPPPLLTTQEPAVSFGASKSIAYVVVCIAIHALAGAPVAVLFAGVLIYYSDEYLSTDTVAATAALLLFSEKCAADDHLMLLRWGACAVWTCLLGGVAPTHKAAHAGVVLLALLMLIPSPLTQPCDIYYYYPPFVFRAAVYILLNAFDEDCTHHRSRMLRYGAALFATNTLMLVAAAAALVAARPSRRLQQAAAFRSMMQSAVASFIQSEEPPHADDAQPQIDKAL